MTIAQDIAPAPGAVKAPGLSALNVTKKFGSLVALDNVSMTVRPGMQCTHLSAATATGKSTLVKCVMGYYLPDSGQISLGDQPVVIRNPREALRLGIGMVYQHFTLVPNMTVAENLVLSRGKVPSIIDWKKEYADLRAFMKTTPFFIPIGAKVSSLAAGQKQKLEICKQLYLKNKVLFLDEPTSVLTPAEADELLTMLKERTVAGDLTVLMITHKFREVMKFADEVTVLRTGRFAGKGLVKDLSPTEMSAMMIGLEQTRGPVEYDNTRGVLNPAHQWVCTPARRHRTQGAGRPEPPRAFRRDPWHRRCFGQRAEQTGRSAGGAMRWPKNREEYTVHGEAYGASRAEIRNRMKVNCLPKEHAEEHLRPGSMSVAQNMAMRNFDTHRCLSFQHQFWLNKTSIRCTGHWT